MIDWERHLPTFAAWARRFSRSPALQVARDAWAGTEQECVIEVGRGVRRLTIWEFGPLGKSQLKLSEVHVQSREGVADGLESDLREFGVSGLACDVLLHPPWAVAKTFELTPDDAQNPTQWIARHRTEVIPSGIENDVIMTLSLRKRQDNQSTLLVGLARRSIVDPVREAVARAGCDLRATIVGPLSALERIELPPDDADTIAIERTGVGSIGCWVYQEEELLGWAEVPVGQDIGPDFEGEVSRRIGSFLGGETGRSRTSRHVFIPAYEPPPGSVSRWRIPRSHPTGQLGIISYDRRSDSNVRTLRAWLNWSFRWCTAIAAVGLMLAGVAACVSTIALSLSGSDSDRISAIDERHKTLSTELRALEEKAKNTKTASSDSRLGRFWYDLGSEKPPGLWLRQMKAGSVTSSGRSTVWLIEGLASDKDAPRRYADNLGSGGGYQTRLTRLEKVDTARLKDLPVSPKSDLYRFAIEAQP